MQFWEYFIIRLLYLIYATYSILVKLANLRLYKFKLLYFSLNIDILILLTLDIQFETVD